MVTPLTRQGYKQTEIGIIPEDWKVITFEETFDFLSTATYSRDKLSENKSAYYIHYGDIHTKWNYYLDFNKDTVPTIENWRLDDYSLIKEGDLVIADASEDYEGIGKSIEIKNIGIKKAISGLHTLLLRDKKNIFVNGFRAYLIPNRLVKRQLDRLATGLKVYGISKNNIKLIQIPCPSKTEQTAIVRALFDTNALVKALDKLIEKKKNIKKGVTQQLLSGKKRLPGFNDFWVSKQLKELLQIPVSDGPHLTPKFLNEGIPFLSVNNLVNNRIDLSELRYISKQDHELFSKKCKPRKGDILLGKAASVGLVAVADLEFEFNIWSPIALIRLNNQHVSRFFYYCFQSRFIINQIKLFTNSSSQGNLGMGDIEKLEFQVPSKEEQSAIAKVLSDIDEEIEEVERQRDKYKLLKTGMMQQLLTGRVRLPC